MAAAIKGTVSGLMDKLNLGSKETGVPPKEPSEDEVQELRKKYKEHGQEHVFTFWDDLKVAEKAALFDQLSSFDPKYINDITQKALNPPKEDKDQEKTKDDESKDQDDGKGDDENNENDGPKLSPLPESATSSVLDSKPEDLKSWYDAGLKLISENQVAVVLMAGGQGTRLGSSDPKGCFNIGLPSAKSLFQLQGERIVKLQLLAQAEHRKETVIVPWYIMTSGPTRKPTEKFFQDNNYFGLPKENILIFEQGVLPCISNDGKILLESKSKAAVAPDGNGGIYQALLTSQVRTNMRDRGIKHIHAYCVDNCLVKVADPTFIGFAAEKKASIATKVVRKRNAKESVGLILLKNGKPDVVEYSEIDSETAEAKDPKNHEVLKFRAANIVNHYYSFDFLETIEEWVHKLPHHVAKKKIPYCDLENGNTVKPDKPNGIKLEQFVFDVFPMLKLDEFACMEVKREDEFSPLKNAKGTGEDDPDTSKKDILSQGARWVQAAGATVESEKSELEVEVSPLISYGGEGLEFLKGKTLKAPAVVEKQS